MRPEKILYVDDEAMSLKYFERLISPLAPIVIALSVEQAKAMLREQGDSIAVLVSDQRMPGANGSELLRYTRDNHPHIVRMMTTAYSGLSEAIDAINHGEIYRYITKPWDLESLRANLRDALELATVRNQHNKLLSEKILVQQNSLLASRISQLAMICAGFVRRDYGSSLNAFLLAAIKVGCSAPSIDWRLLDHAQLMQREAQRAIALGELLAQWQQDFDNCGVDSTSEQALHALAKMLPAQFTLQGNSLLVHDSCLFTAPITGAIEEAPQAAQAAWLAWLLWSDQHAQLQRHEPGWQINLFDTQAKPPPANWLATSIEQALQETQ